MRRGRVSHVMQCRLVSRAGDMRRAPTSTEAALWSALRGSRLGVGFRRQVVVGRHIVDFMAPSARLVVEVDGGYHAMRERADARRDAALQAAGYRVVRVSADAVVRDLGGVVAVIREALERA